MLKRTMFTFIALIAASSAIALSPAPGFKVKNTLGEITTYELTGKDIEINGMSSEFKYEDHYQDLNTAMAGAKQRSLKSLSVIYVHRHAGGFCVNAHGVLKMHHVEICKFKKGAGI